MRIQNAKNYGVTQKEIGAGSTGICTLLCVMLKNTKHIIMYKKNEERIQFINKYYPDALNVSITHRAVKI